MLLPRSSVVGAALLAGCSAKPPAASQPALAPLAVQASTTTPPSTSVDLSADTPIATPSGAATFTAPSGWTLGTSGPLVVLTAPERTLRVGIFEATGPTAKDAFRAAWQAFEPGFARAPRTLVANPAREGWDERKTCEYVTSPNERRVIGARALRHGSTWTVAVVDGDRATYQKRTAQVALVRGSLRPRGFVKESFAGKKARTLDSDRTTALTAFLDHARESAGIPGIALSLVQDGKVVYAGGSGVRAAGEPAKVDADTLFLIASNTKQLTTLLLAEEVDDGKFGWDTPVTSVFPDFRLGDPETTRQVRMKHLVCACTGLPRRDYEWLYEFGHATPRSELDLLATFQPTSRFGEVFQYSNTLAAAAGYVAAYAAAPSRELGAEYDALMQSRVFDPLGMTATTLDFDRAIASNHASPHNDGLDGTPAVSDVAIDRSSVPIRPSAGAWSSARDLAKYVTMELSNGVLPNGQRLVSEANLRVRREKQVYVGEDVVYGMGLQIDTTWGVPVIHHGGILPGYRTDVFWIPEANVGGAILTNAENGELVLHPFLRRLVEVLYDGKPEAEEDFAFSVTTMREGQAGMRKNFAVPPDPNVVAKLAPRYRNASLGELRVGTDARGVALLDVGEWRGAFASRRNADGTVSLMILTPRLAGWSFVVGENAGGRTLVLRDAQRDYVFEEVK